MSDSEREHEAVAAAQNRAKDANLRNVERALAASDALGPMRLQQLESEVQRLRVDLAVSEFGHLRDRAAALYEKVKAGSVFSDRILAALRELAEMYPKER